MPAVPLILIGVIFVALIYGPQLWAQYTFRRYARPREDIPGSGAELARHLLDKFNMNHVKVERTGPNEDHYSSSDKAVRLSPENFDRHSLTAITVAAHEVGHAIQDQQNDPMLRRRHKLIQLTQQLQQLGMWMLGATFLLGLFTRSPLLGIITVAAGLLVMGVSVVVNLVTLPVEFDASFNKALPILFEGNYVAQQDRKAAKRILKAAAYTYVAASLANLLNLARWIALLRR